MLVRSTKFLYGGLRRSFTGINSMENFRISLKLRGLTNGCVEKSLRDLACL